MAHFKKRSLQKEILDQKDIPFVDIALNMKELDWINSHLGGHSITIKGFKKLLRQKEIISVCEIGCGGGDNLNALHQFCYRKNIRASFCGIDINEECIAFAKENTAIKNPDFIISDYKNVDFRNGNPDIIFSSLFCHHFSEEELTAMMKWMKANSKLGFFINDLHRHFISYHFIRLATKIFSKSYLVKNDAPLSVLRGFKKNEWRNILENAGIENYSLKWEWAFRFLIIVPNSDKHWISQRAIQ